MYKSGEQAVALNIIKLCIGAATKIIKGLFEAFDKSILKEKASTKRRDIVLEDQSKVAGFNL